jgi:PAS domain S-box-containing protein
MFENSSLPLMWIGALLGLALLVGLGLYVRRVLAVRRRIEDRLRQLSRAVEQSPSIVVITDIRGNIEYVNPKFTEVTGYTLDEIRGQNPRILKSGETSPAEYAHLWRIITGGGEWHGEFHNVKKNGDSYWEYASISPIKSPDGIITHFLAVKEDITARKAAEAAEHEQRQLAEALRNTAAALNSTLDLETVLDRILQSIDPLFPHDSAYIMLIEDGVARVVRVCSHTRPEDHAGLLTLRLTVENIPDLRRMAHAGQPLVIPDTRANPDWHSFEETKWIRSIATAPIYREGRALGFVNITSRQPDAFTPLQAERLKAFADQAATAIDNARLFAAEREQRALAEALSDTAALLNSTLSLEEVLEHILANVGRVVPHDAASILLIEDGVARVVRSRGYGSPDLVDHMLALRFPVDQTPGIRHMVGTRQPLMVPDVTLYPGWVDPEGMRWTRSYVGAPIRLYGAVIGILGLHSRTPGAFTLTHADRLLAFADQAAIAIQNARLFAAARDQAQDLSRRVAERTRELEHQRAQLSTILDALDEGVTYMENGKIMYANQALLRVLKITPERLRDDPSTLFKQIVVGGDSFERVWADILATFARRQNWRTQWRLRRLDGSEFFAEITFSMVGDGPINNVIVIRDISQEKTLQAQKNRFLTHAAHELRTPISNIKTRLYLLRKQPERSEQHLAVIEHVSDNLMDLANDLLDVVRFEHQVLKLDRQRLALQPLIQEVIALQLPDAENNNVWLVYEMPDAPVEVCADQLRLRQVITKLLINAIHSSPENGHVSVQLATQTVEDSTHALIQVRDSGSGIEPELLDQVFEPFFRANQADSEGLGLGLAIARQIIEQHGGTIWVENTGGQGCVFSIQLALAGEVCG